MLKTPFARSQLRSCLESEILSSSYWGLQAQHDQATTPYSRPCGINPPHPLPHCFATLAHPRSAVPSAGIMISTVLHTGASGPGSNAPLLPRASYRNPPPDPAQNSNSFYH